MKTSIIISILIACLSAFYPKAEITPGSRHGNPITIYGMSRDARNFVTCEDGKWVRPPVDRPLMIEDILTLDSNEANLKCLFSPYNFEGGGTGIRTDPNGESPARVIIRIINLNGMQSKAGLLEYMGGVGGDYAVMINRPKGYSEDDLLNIGKIKYANWHDPGSSPFVIVVDGSIVTIERQIEVNSHRQP